MIWLIDTDVFIEGERGNPAFLSWLEDAEGVATTDIIRAEFLLGVHAVADTEKRKRGEQFYRNCMIGLPSFACETTDYISGARLAGEARRQNKGKPSLVDGVLAAIALRTGATVATRNLTDFQAMGCPCEKPF